MKGRNTDLFTRNHYTQTGDSGHDFPDSFLPSDMWGSNWPVYTSAHHPWEESPPPGVAKRYRLTPISPQWFWNLKPCRRTVPFSLSAYSALCECWWYWYRKKRKRWREKNRREKRCPPEKRGIWQIAARQNFRASIFHVSAGRPRTRGTRFEHFSSSRTERNRLREIRSHVLCICRCIQSREKSLVIFLNWCNFDNAIGCCLVARKPMTRFA